MTQPPETDELRYRSRDCAFCKLPDDFAAFMAGDDTKTKSASSAPVNRTGLQTIDEDLWHEITDLLAPYNGAKGGAS